MLRAVLFDLGGVVFDSPFDGFTRYEAQAGLPSGLIRRLNATNPDSNAWARFERGELDRDGFIRAFEDEALAAGHRVEGLRVLESLRGEVRPAMLVALHRLREAGVKLAAVTNNIAPMAVDGRHGGFLEVFDTVVESSVEGIRKPEPAFYAIALDRLQVTARECAYLDDLGVNLKPARAMGMATIKVTDPQAALAELEELVGVRLLDRPA